MWSAEDLAHTVLMGVDIRVNQSPGSPASAALPAGGSSCADWGKKGTMRKSKHKESISYQVLVVFCGCF